MMGIIQFVKPRFAIVIVFILLLFVGSEQLLAKAATPAVSQIGSLERQYSTSSTLANYMVPAGTDRLLVVVAAHTRSLDVTGVTFGATAMTEALEEHDGFAVNAFYVLPMGTSTSATTANIVMTNSGGMAGDEKYLSAAVFQNVDQTTPVEPTPCSPTNCDDDDTDGAATIISSLTIPSEAGDLVIDHFNAFGSAEEPTIIIGAGQDVLHANLGGSTAAGGDNRYMSSTQAGAASVTSTWTGQTTSSALAIMHMVMNMNAAFYLSNPKAQPSNEPTNFLATADSPSQITTSWTDATGTTLPDSYLVLCNTTGSFTAPTDSFPVADDADCSDGVGAQTVMQGTETAVWATLNAETQYFFTIYPFTNFGVYTDYKTDSPASDDTFTLPIEPANQPTNFAATTISNTEITTTWTDAAGSPDGYLVTCVLAATGALPPNDGPLVADDAAACGSGGVGTINIGPGIETYSWTGLVPGSVYRFAIYAYNEAGGNANYKTDSFDTVLQTTGCPASPLAVSDTETLLIGVNCYKMETSGIYVLDLTQDITLTTSPWIINTSATAELHINGNGHHIDGDNSYKPFRVISGRLTLTSLTLQNGNDGSQGGAIRVEPNGTTTLTDVSIYSSSATGGGAIYIDEGTVTINSSTLAGNSAPSGGAIYNNQGTLTINNSTLSGNEATVIGGGVLSQQAATTMTNSTITDNSSPNGSGIHSYQNTVTLNNTIVAHNTGSANCVVDNGGVFSADAFNLDNDGSCDNATQSATINLGTLQDNGGATMTHALLSGSAAIDAGNNAVCVAAPINNVDQRGIARPQGTTCDVGAFERQTAVSPTLSINSTPALEWLPAQSTCVNTLWYSTAPYGVYMDYAGDPATFDVATPLASSSINAFWYMDVACDDTTAVSNNLGEFTFDIVPGS
ncbi:MAG: choice-of-anchor Q domain-containing protein [Chloroflexota bacterium]